MNCFELLFDIPVPLLNDGMGKLGFFAEVFDRQVGDVLELMDLGANADDGFTGAIPSPDFQIGGAQSECQQREKIEGVRWTERLVEI